jgi:hypothetical protein
VRVTSISFGSVNTEVLAGGTCGTGGTGAVFSHLPGSGWQRLSLPVSGQLVRFTTGTALVEGKAGLAALWLGTGRTGYPGSATASPPSASLALSKSAPLPHSGSVTASGTLPGAGAWVLLPGGRAATVSLPGTAGGTPQWVPLPPVPARTSVLASGPDGATDALAVSGTTVTVWRLVPKATEWAKVQTISVPIQAGSSS